MDNEDELVQVSVNLPKSHISILPELMKVVTTACRSAYSWDSMKLSVDCHVSIDNGARMILNLGKSVKPDSEIIQGKFHRCCDSICKHNGNKEDVVGELKMTKFGRRTMRDYFKEQIEEEDTDGTGWVEKKVSDEMFFPSWYDHLRMKSVPQLSDDLFPPDNSQDHSFQQASTNNIQLQNYFESESEDFFPLKYKIKTFNAAEEEVSDETFRLKKICDMAKISTQIQEETGDKRITNVNDYYFEDKQKIRDLKDRLDSTIVYENKYAFRKSTVGADTEETNYSYRRYLCYDEDISTYPPCNTDQSSILPKTIRDSPKERQSKGHDLQKELLRIRPSNEFHALSSQSPKEDNKDDEMLVVMPSSIKKTVFHRSYSANVVSRHYESTCSREFSPSTKKKEEKKRPKSGPEKKVEFIRPVEHDELSQGDNIKLQEALQRSSVRNIKNPNEQLAVDGAKEKRKRRRTLEAAEKNAEVNSEFHKDISGKDHEKRPKERKHKAEDSRCKDSPTLVISYKPLDDDARSDANTVKQKHRRDDKENKPDSKHKKSRKDERPETSKDIEFKVVERVDDKRERRSRGKEDEKRMRRPKSEKGDKTKTIDSRISEGKSPKSLARADILKKERELKENKPWEKIKRRGFLGKRSSPGTTVNEETLPSTEEKTETDLDDKPNKRALSFLELISAMTEEVIQFGKKRDQKRIRDKIT